jgi:pSer/pThr/pTyr-binding forkhead associated (FHA) protein
MRRPPAIIVQLVHIQGPLKGEIQEFFESDIAIGRSPSCQVRFPADLAIVSRHHASITREGNRFKLTDRSTNGTLVNGKLVQEVYLTVGDVLEFARGGPKVSFLTQMREGEVEAPSMPLETPLRKAQIPPELEPRATEEYEIPISRSEPRATEEISSGKAKVPVVIQYGPTLRSYKEVPVLIGRTSNSDFVIDHPAVLDRHAQIFFHQDHYWVKDLTGQNLVMINRQPISTEVALTAEDELALSPQGPCFRFLGGGRFAEVEE